MSRENLVQECRREFDNCHYTAVSHLLWLRAKRNVRFWFIVLPLVFGAVATFEIIKKSDDKRLQAVAVVCAALAGLMPAIYSALKFDDDLDKLRVSASEFTNLRDRFRQVAILSTNKSFKDFEAEFDKLMVRMEAARRASLTAPERYFKAAQEKINSGDYNYDVDEPPNPEVVADAPTKPVQSQVGPAPRILPPS